MPDIFTALGEAGVAPDIIQLTDIGAMESDGTDPWSRLVERGMGKLLGFEPQAEECAKCNATAGPECRFLPEALGDGATRPFHQCRYPPTSSFKKPNIEVISRYEELPQLMEVVETMPIATRRLDDVDEARHTDFLKIDVQGAELDVLEHGREILDQVGMIQIEVCFQQLYEDQPLLADIDQFLRSRGFDFHSFLRFGTRLLRPLLSLDVPTLCPRHLLWSDALYIRAIDPSSPGVNPDLLLKRAILLDQLYQSCDFAARDLKLYDRLAGQRTFDAYASMLCMRQAA